MGCFSREDHRARLEVECDETLQVDGETHVGPGRKAHDPAALRLSVRDSIVHGQRVDRFAVAGRSEGAHVKAQAGAVGGCGRKHELPCRAAANRGREQPEKVSPVHSTLPSGAPHGRAGQGSTVGEFSDSDFLTPDADVGKRVLGF